MTASNYVAPVLSQEVQQTYINAGAQMYADDQAYIKQQQEYAAAQERGYAGNPYETMAPQSSAQTSEPSRDQRVRDAYKERTESENKFTVTGNTTAMEEQRKGEERNAQTQKRLEEAQQALGTAGTAGMQAGAEYGD